jgi:hypothetical protein
MCCPVAVGVLVLCALRVCVCVLLWGSQTAQSTLKSEYKEDLSWSDALKLSVKTLIKAMDTTAPSSEKLELQTLQRYEMWPPRHACCGHEVT